VQKINPPSPMADLFCHLPVAAAKAIINIYDIYLVY
jgi:hypothetical protein